MIWLGDCGDGVFRSPHVALLAKVARGCDPYHALADVTRATYSAYGSVPHWHRETVAEILGLDMRRPEAAR